MTQTELFLGLRVKKIQNEYSTQRTNVWEPLGTNSIKVFTERILTTDYSKLLEKKKHYIQTNKLSVTMNTNDGYQMRINQ